MIEILKEFLLFGVIEIFILLMFYKYVGKIEKVKYWHGLVLCPMFFVVGLIQFPYAKQIGMMIIMIAYLSAISKKANIKIVLFGALYLLVIEMIFCMLYDLSNIVDLFLLKNDIIYKFLYLIPVRLTEIIFLILYNLKRRR